jgi:Icc protein
MHQIVSWIHFGDLHISDSDEQNYRDFVTLIDEANRKMASGIDFALLPGDKADDGEENQYQLVKTAVSDCRFPVHAISGDHDIASGRLDLFLRYLAKAPYGSFMCGEYCFLLLNSVAQWRPPEFGLGVRQMIWLHDRLSSASLAGQRAVIFMHAYPSEHKADAAALREMFREHRVLLVEMGHTHYNELANDGHTIYATTRSTGQVEEGPPGFSVTTLDDGAVSWIFKPIGAWPLVMITSPADERLITDPQSLSQVIRGQIQVRARAWGDAIGNVTLSIDQGTPIAMQRRGSMMWTSFWDSLRTSDGPHLLSVTAKTADGHTASDTISVLVNQQGSYSLPARRNVDYENVLGEWPEKHLLGTQLGPNENGRQWPSRRKSERVAR